MTKKEIIKILEQKDKITGFRNLKLLKEYLQVYCYENIENFKELKEFTKGYLFKYNKSFYYCFYDGIANYIDNELYKKYELLELHCNYWKYDKDNLEHVIIDDNKEIVLFDSDGLKYVNYNNKKLYLFDFSDIEKIKGCC